MAIQNPRSRLAPTKISRARSRLLLLLLLLSSLTAYPADAQPSPQTGSLVGTVHDESGRPLGGATVLLRDAATGLARYGTPTHDSGIFEVRGIERGRYALIVSYLGYAEFRQALTVAPGIETEVQVRLTSRAVPQDEIVVVGVRARRTRDPVTVSNMTARELEQQPSMKDLPVLLSTLPSITYHSENGNGIGYSTLRMRGFDQRRIAVAINGIPQNDPEDHNVFWINFFDVQGAVQDIQVQRGAGSSRYGSTAIGGAVNIAAFPYRSYPYALAEVGYGTYETRRFTAEANTGLLNDRYVAFGRFSRLLTDGYRDWAWSEFWRFFAGVVRYGRNSTLTLQAYGGPQYDGLAYSGIPKAANEEPIADGFGGEIDRRYNFSALAGDVERFHQPHVELLHDLHLTDRLSLHQALFWVKGEGYFDFGGTFRSADYLRLPESWRDLGEQERRLPLFLTADDVSVLFRAYLDQWQVGWIPRVRYRHSMGETTVGAEARLHRSVRWGRIQEATGIPEGLVGSENDVRTYQFHGEKVIGSAYGSHLFRPVDWLAVQADLQISYQRYRHYQERFFGNAFTVPYLFVNPRVGVTFNPERPLSAYGSIAWASKEPRLKSIYDGEEAGAGFLPQFERRPDGSLNFDEPLVKPERLMDVEIGVALTRSRYRIALNGFYMDFRDEIVPSGGLDQFGVPRSGNADRTRHLGIEAEAAMRLLPRLDVSGNVTLSRNRFVRFSEFVLTPSGAPIELNRDDNPIAGFPERVANVVISYSLAGLQGQLRAKVAGKQYIDNTGGRDPDGTVNDQFVVDPYAIMDVSLRYAFPQGSPLGGVDLAFDVNNLLNDRVLLYGNVGPAGPQFFPLATRHVFASMRYVLRR